MKNIIFGLVVILLAGVFIYVKIKDSDSINSLNIAVENHRTGTEQLLRDITEIGKQLTISESIRKELELVITEIGKQLTEAENRIKEHTGTIESSIDTAGTIKEIDSEFRNTIKESLSIIGELKEYDFRE